MRYLPLTEEEKQNILTLCEVSSFDELVDQIPQNLKLDRDLDLAPALSESELKDHLAEIAQQNSASRFQCFLGQGVYDHNWPSAIDQITNRGEFLTAYTPYQPELAQGTLQCIFEFQSMISDLFGMEVSNASVFDGSTALMEAVMMCSRISRKGTGKILVSEGCYDRSIELLKTYLEPRNIDIVSWPANPKTLIADLDTLPEASDDVIAVIAQSPNKWGHVENWQTLKTASQQMKSLSVGHVAHPYSLAIFSPPGDHDIDIATGEGQCFGLPMGFGGPYLGLLTCQQKYVRQLPGRLVGATQDADGQRAFCVTLATREQHIRRERATSNICSNQNLMLVRATIFLSLMGPEGLRRLAKQCFDKALYAKRQLADKLTENYPQIKVSPSTSFNEISVLVPSKETLWIDESLDICKKHKILAGLKITVPKSSGYVNALNIAFTERYNKKDIDFLSNLLARIPNEEQV